jgi:hypothetical protein
MDDLIKPEVRLVQALAERAMAAGARPEPESAPSALGQIPFWPANVRGMPNVLLRCAIFNANNPNAARVQMKKEKLASLENFEITFTGEDLRQDESNLLEELLHLARDTVLSERIEVSGYALLKRLGAGTSKKDYAKLVTMLERLQAGQITLKFHDGRDGFIGSLVRKIKWRGATETGTTGKTKWIIYLEPEVIRLFSGDDYTRLGVELRQKLKLELSKWLYNYYHTHAEPFPYSVATIHRLCGSQAKQLFHFRANLRKALEELKSIGFLKDWRIDEKDLVHVTRVSTKPIAATSARDQARLTA